MIVFKYERIPRKLALSVPDNWEIRRSENEWMTGETFYEFISNIFHPWLEEKKIEKPVILFIDGHSSHTPHCIHVNSAWTIGLFWLHCIPTQLI